MNDLRQAAQQALDVLEQLQGGCTDSNDGTVEAITVWCPEVIDALRAALAQAEPDHETRAELAEQQVVQLAEERDHYRSLWQKAQAEPVEAAQKSGEFRVMVCGVDCHPGDQHCNGYCTGKTDDPPEATAEQQAEPAKRKPATGAESCVPSPSFQMTTQAEPPCDHCRSPLFAALQCRVCGRKVEPK